MNMDAFELSQLLADQQSSGNLYLEFLRVPALSAGLYVLPAGQPDPQQPHAEDEVYYVLQGRGAIRVADEDRPVQPGSIIYVAAGVVLSPWLMAFSIFLFLSLAAVKRQAELTGDLARGREGSPGRSYVVGDLPIVAMMALAAGYVSVLVMALYLNSDTVRELYGAPFLLWGVCPVLLYWISRVVMLTHRGWMHDDPVVFALRDMNSRICVLLVVGIAMTASLL